MWGGPISRPWSDQGGSPANHARSHKVAKAEWGWRESQRPHPVPSIQLPPATQDLLEEGAHLTLLCMRAFSASRNPMSSFKPT